MRMTCPLTSAKEFLATNLVDSLELDRSTQHAGPFFQDIRLLPQLLVARPVGQTPLRGDQQLVSPSGHHWGLNGVTPAVSNLLPATFLKKI